MFIYRNTNSFPYRNSYRCLYSEETPLCEPRARVISPEPKRNIVAATADGDHVTADRIGIVIGGAARTPNNIKGVLDHCQSELWLLASEYVRRANGMGGKVRLVPEW